MHSYKSLFVVIVMGGVLFMVAGILVTTDAAQRKKAQSNSNSAELPERARIGDREILLRGRGANASPAGTSFEHEIGEFREWLATPAARDAAAKVRTRGLVSMLCRNVQASDWPLLAAELERKDSPDEYRGNLLVIAGAARVDQALPYFEKYGASLPSKVAEAFRLDGRDQAFAVLTNLYRQSTQSGAKYLYLGAIRNFSSAVVRPFLRHQLTAENDLEALMQVVTLSRFFPDAELALALVDFARGASTDRQAAARRAMNSVAGMELGDAGRAVFEAWWDASEPELLRSVAGEALAFMKHPALVTEIASRLQQAPERCAEPALRFLERNAGGKDRDALSGLLDVLTGDPATRVEAIINRL